MSSSTKRSTVSTAAAGVFRTTRWSVVFHARQLNSAEASAALEQLCRTYWYPLYAFVRRQGHDPHDAQDLTQEFFARLLAGHQLESVDRAKGRFRSFLLAALKHFLANEWDRRKAQKRGGREIHLSIDTQSAEDRYRLEPADPQSAEKIYERRWALTLLDRVLDLMKLEAEAAGKGDHFQALKIALTVDRRAVPYADLARGLGMTEGAVKVAVHRMRQRYRELLRAEIAHTVSDAQAVDAEIRHLFAALAG
jgi:RNA polymerase sigma-70 factor (ECF subfamily)